jgi:hypothetical protein
LFMARPAPRALRPCDRPSVVQAAAFTRALFAATAVGVFTPKLAEVSTGTLRRRVRSVQISLE